jgi:neutral amino acid transport system substrate-binding protein
MLRAEAFLLNTPFGALEGYTGLSPSISLPSECVVRDGAEQGPTNCSRDNATRFARHFAARWDGAQPFPAAHFYYDAVVLLAMGLEYALSRDGTIPGPAKLRNYVRELGDSDAETGAWTDLGGALAKLSRGTKLRYVGAAAEYRFDEYGEAQHVIFDAWKVARETFNEEGSLTAICPRAH